MKCKSNLSTCKQKLRALAPIPCSKRLLIKLKPILRGKKDRKHENVVLRSGDSTWVTKWQWLDLTRQVLWGSPRKQGYLGCVGLEGSSIDRKRTLEVAPRIEDWMYLKHYEIVVMQVNGTSYWSLGELPRVSACWGLGVGKFMWEKHGRWCWGNCSGMIEDNVEFVIWVLVGVYVWVRVWIDFLLTIVF